MPIVRASADRDRRDRTIVITGIGHRDRADRPSWSPGSGIVIARIGHGDHVA